MPVREPKEKKGDLPRDSRGYKINTIMPKLICLYEDIVNESGEKSENPRYKLIGKSILVAFTKEVGVMRNYGL